MPQLQNQTGRVHGAEDEIHARVGVFVSGHGAFEEPLGGGVARVVARKGGVALAVGGHEGADDAEPGAFGVAVFAFAGMGAVGEDAFDVPLVGVEEESDEGLFVVGVSAGVGFDDEAQAGGGRFVVPLGGGAREGGEEGEEGHRLSYTPFGP